MFSGQQGQAPSPWAQKSTQGGFGTPAPSNMGDASYGASPAQPPSMPFGAQTPGGTPGVHSAPAQNAPGWKPNTPQSGLGWGQPSTPSYGVPHPSAMPLGAQGTYSPAPPNQPSPMQPGQAPVQYLPGYLNKMRGDRTLSSSYRPNETASPPAREADASMAGKDAGTGARTMPSSSPSHFLSSAFFNNDENARGTREGSIFGGGSLRGHRKQEDGDRSMSVRAPTSPPAVSQTPFFGTDYGASAMDDEDAPPQEALGDVTQQPMRMSFTQSVVANSASSPLAVSSRDKAQTDAPLEQRVVLVYGFPAYLYDRVVEQFASIGGLLKAEDLSNPPSQKAADEAGSQLGPASHPVVVRLTYAAAYQALLAVRRSGELLANSCMVGVRWENEGLHQLSLVKGLDAPLGQHTDATQGPMTPAPNRTAQPASKTAPLFGRPIDVVGTPVSALARTSTTAASPLRAVVQAGEALLRGSSHTGASARQAPTGPVAPPSGVLGRLADGLFGW